MNFKKTSSQEPLGQFQQVIFRGREVKSISMKVSILFQKDIITKLQKYINKFQKSSSTNPLSQFHANFAQCILG